MSKWLRLAAVPFIAGAAIASATTTFAWAFTQETLHPNGNYNFNYGPLDDNAKSGQSVDKSGPNSPGFHFNVEHGQQTSPFGFHSFGDDNSSNTRGYFHEPLGNGN